MDRRRFVAAIGSALAAPLTRAQGPAPAPLRRIGVLGLAFEPRGPRAERPALVTLRKLGWIEGENLVIERAFAELRMERLAPMAEELVRKRVEILWTNGPDATLAAARASQKIPIVFYDVPYPVEQGLIESFGRPGRNATGTSFFTDAGVGEKLYEFLREVAPGARRLARLIQPDPIKAVDGRTLDVGPDVGRIAGRIGFDIRTHEVRSLEDIDRVFAEISASRADCIIAGGGSHLFAARQKIAEFALRNRLASAFFFYGMADAGGLLSYGVSPSETVAMTIRTAEYVDRILRGARPGDLPVQRPSKYDLVINARTAKAIGLTIPQSMIARADRVIE